MFRIGKSIEPESRLVVPWLGGEGRRVTVNGHGFFGGRGDVNILKLMMLMTAQL